MLDKDNQRDYKADGVLLSPWWEGGWHGNPTL